MQVKIETCGVSFESGKNLIIAETEAGERFVHEHADLAFYSASNLARHVTEKAVIETDRWFYSFPRYGSPAYEVEEAEAFEYAQCLRNGRMDESDVPFPYNSML